MLAASFSLALHGLLIALLLVGWTSKSPPRALPQPSYIQATLIQMKSKGGQTQQKQVDVKKAEVAVTKPVEQKVVDKSIKQVEIEKVVQRKAAEQKIAQEKVAQQKKAQEKVAQEKVAQQKKAQEKVAQEKVAQQKKAQEKVAQEKVAQQKKAQEKVAREKKEALEKQAKAAAEQERQRKARAQALSSALDSEESFLADEQSELMAQSYTSYFQDKIAMKWNRPLSARKEMEVVLSIQLVPTGQVVGVSIVKSSGDTAFDLSAEQAVKNVGRFEKMQELSRTSPAVFEGNFRKFTLVFRADDLRL